MSCHPSLPVALVFVVVPCVVLCLPVSCQLLGPIAEWDVSSVSDMSNLFADANYFNGELSKWDVSSVSDMTGMFTSAMSFNGDISKWDASNVRGMTDIFMRVAARLNPDSSIPHPRTSTLMPHPSVPQPLLRSWWARGNHGEEMRGNKR